MRLLLRILGRRPIPAPLEQPIQGSLWAESIWLDLAFVVREGNRYCPTSSLEARYAELRPLALAQPLGRSATLDALAICPTLDAFLLLAPTNCAEVMEEIAKILLTEHQEHSTPV